MLDKLKLETIFKHYNEEHQLNKLYEELSELMFELEKDELVIYKGLDDLSLEEMADVLHLILQFMTVPEYKEKIEKQLKFKNERQLRRIQQEKDKKNEVV